MEDTQANGEVVKRAAAPRRKRKPVAAARGQSVKPIKTTIYLSARARLALVVHSEIAGQTLSEAVESLILGNLKRYVVSDRQAGQGGEEPSL